uniref:Putative lipoyltransferase n=1 Tax=Trypanosoma congolense (strain IL3000) TaxID=1068625 RepID=G0UR00_TRYCI|nr:putative lipoyltransferase [Trypanosoma congolense IL3000]
MRSTIHRLFSGISLPNFISRHDGATKCDRILNTKQRAVALHSNSNVIYENLAAEEAILRGVVLCPEETLLLTYVNAPCVVLGRNQNLFREISLQAARRDGVSVSRRNSGGGAVYHDEGNISFSVFTHRAAYEPQRSIQILRLHLCHEYGIVPERISTTHRHDLFLDGKKITGSAMRVQRDIACHHFTLLVSSCRQQLGKYLKSEGSYVSFTTTAVDSVRSPTTTLQEAGVVTPPCGNCGSEGLVTDVLQKAVDFFIRHASLVMTHKEPWNLDLSVFSSKAKSTSCQLGCKSNEGEKNSFSFVLDVSGAIRGDVAMTDGEGRRPFNGASKTVREEADRLQSTEWLFNMPKFETRVAVAMEDLIAWEDIVTGRKELTPGIIKAFCGNSDCIEIHTCVETRRVTSIGVVWIKDGERLSDVPWFECLLKCLIEGEYVDNMSISMEESNASLSAAMAMECPQHLSHLASVAPAAGGSGSFSDVNSPFIMRCGTEMERAQIVTRFFLRAVVGLWRLKNVFFPLKH